MELVVLDDACCVTWGGAPSIGCVHAFRYSSGELQGRLQVPSNTKLCHDFETTAYVESKGKDRWSKGDAMPCYIDPNVTAQNLDYFGLDVLMRASGDNDEATLDKTVRVFFFNS
jgi:hypothetical protein